MGIKRVVLAAAAASAALAIMGTPAFAGETKGNGGSITVNARSECAYSGLEDGSEEGSTAGPGNTQSWGTIPKADRDFLRTIGVSPAALCNGHLNPIK